MFSTFLLHVLRGLPLSFCEWVPLQYLPSDILLGVPNPSSFPNTNFLFDVHLSRPVPYFFIPDVGLIQNETIGKYIYIYILHELHTQILGVFLSPPFNVPKGISVCCLVLLLMSQRASQCVLWSLFQCPKGHQGVFLSPSFNVPKGIRVCSLVPLSMSQRASRCLA